MIPVGTKLRSTVGRSVLQSTADSEAIYHHGLVQPGLDALAPTGPRDVLILGAGECATVRDVLKAPAVERVVAVDIDELLIEATLRYLPQWHAGALDDPRVELRIEDARDTLAEAPAASFDLVIVDLNDPSDADLGEVDVQPPLNEAFFRAVHRVLRPGGVVTGQIGETDPPPAAGVVSPVPALEAVFGEATTHNVYISGFDCDWSFALARKI